MSNGWGNVPRIDSGRLIACLAGGATLIMDCMDELSPQIRALSGPRKLSPQAFGETTEQVVDMIIRACGARTLTCDESPRASAIG